MSSISKTDQLSARVSVKVPQPDSLVEVRVTPPDSNFQVKVSPGEDVIELLIQPGSSMVEVRISPPGKEDSARLEERFGLLPGEQFQPDRTLTAQGPVRNEAEGEVLPGVSQAEFAAMVEEEESAEARKLLDQMAEDEGGAAAGQASPGHQLPDEMKEIPASGGDDAEAPETVQLEPEGQGEAPAEAFEAETAPDVSEDDDLDLPAVAGPAPGELIEVAAPAEPLIEEAAAPADESGFDELDEFDLPDAEEPEAPAEARSPEPDEPAPAGENDLEALSLENDAAEVPAPQPAAPAKASSASQTLEWVPVEPDGTPVVEEEDDPIDPEVIGAAALDALARLNLAVQEEKAAMEAAIQPAERPLSGEATAAASYSSSADSTIMVEMYDDYEPGPNPADTITPPPEDELMDLSQVEKDEDLAIDPIDVDGLGELDLERSHFAETGNGTPTIKARPMVQVIPGNTVVPE